MIRIGFWGPLYYQSLNQLKAGHALVKHGIAPQAYGMRDHRHPTARPTASFLGSFLSGFRTHVQVYVGVCGIVESGVRTGVTAALGARSLHRIPNPFPKP